MAGKKYALTFDLYDGTTRKVVFEVPEGDPGPAGPAPVRGTDYWTAEDQAQIKEEVSQKIKAVQYAPQTLTDAQKAQARENIGAAAAGAGGENVPDAVTYSPQTLTADQKLQARANIAAQETLTVENLKDQIVINYPDKITKQFTSFVKYGRICIFTVQIIVSEAISDRYGFIVATLPEATVDRIWINNGTQFFIEVGSNGIRRNGEGLAAGNYMLSGFYLAVE